MNVLQILLTLSGFYFNQANYYISSESSHRENARDVCRLATPEIRYSGEGNTVVLNTTHFPDGGKLWVGYALELTTFRYIGCSHTDDLNDNATMSNIYKKDLGQCYSFCSTQFFGMQETNCYCIYSPPMHIGSYKCKSTCDNPKDTLCGQTENDRKDVSIYMTGVNDTSDSKSNGQYCQAVQRSSEDPNFTWNYVWEACNNSFKYICQIGSFTELNLHFKAINVDSNWHTSMTTCIAFDKHPTGKIDSFNKDIQINDTKSRWIGKIRSFVIKKTEDESNLNHLESRQGYIEWKDGTVNLKFEPSIEDSLQALCYRDNDTTSTVVSIAKTKEGDTPLLGVVFGAIALLIGVTLVAILLRVWWKRKNTVCKKGDPALSHENDHKSASSRNAVSNDSYQDGNEIHEYYVLERVNEYDVIKDAYVKSTVENEYDTTTNLHLKANDDTGNIYNKLEDITDDTYNHTRANATSVEETYDKTTFDEHESTYNTIDVPPGPSTSKYKVTNRE